MKWEKYNLMTPSQKEEYNYRFEDNKIDFPFSGSSIMIYLGLMLVSHLLVLTAYLGLKNPSLGVLPRDLVVWLGFSFKIFVTIGWIIFIEILIWAINLIWNGYKKNKWLKEQGLK